jgi:hypothetical protein
MEQLVTGCERSGTKMLSKRLGEKYNIHFTLENKHTIACFKYHQELQRWNKYKDEKLESSFINKFEKHTLNEEINIEFLKWVKESFPNVKIYYIIRDGRNVVSSIINKVWGHSQTRGEYRINLKEACTQWNTVIDKTWDWALENCEIVKYEDVCNIVSNPLTNEQLIETTNLIHHNLNKTNYNI